MQPALCLRRDPRASEPRHWMEREPGQCAWPIGEGTEVLSCCAPVCRRSSGRSTAYCARHWKAMWRPAPAEGAQP